MASGRANHARIAASCERTGIISCSLVLFGKWRKEATGTDQTIRRAWIGTRLVGPTSDTADGAVWVSRRAEKFPFHDRRLASRLGGVGRDLPGRRIKRIRERRGASQCERENDEPHRSIRVSRIGGYPDTRHTGPGDPLGHSKQIRHASAFRNSFSSFSTCACNSSTKLRLIFLSG